MGIQTCKNWYFESTLGIHLLLCIYYQSTKIPFEKQPILLNVMVLGHIRHMHNFVHILEKHAFASVRFPFFLMLNMWHFPFAK